MKLSGWSSYEPVLQRRAARDPPGEDRSAQRDPRAQELDARVVASALSQHDVAGIGADGDSDQLRRARADPQGQIVITEPILQQLLVGAYLDPREPVRP